MVDTNPLDMENIKEQQDADDALLQHATKIHLTGLSETFFKNHIL
jgi:hypothetical protein